MRLSVYIFLVFFCCANVCFSQGFQRLYEVNEMQPDSMLIHVASTTSTDGATISMFLRSRRLIADKHIVITVQDRKGKFKQKHEITFDGNSLSGIADISYNQNTGFIHYVFSTRKKTILGKIKVDGRENQLRYINGVDTSSLPLQVSPQTEYYADTKDLYGTSDTTLCISMLESEDSILWSSRYLFSDTLNNKYVSKGQDLKVGSTQRMYSIGNIDTSQYLLSIDSLGDVRYARKYSYPQKRLHGKRVAPISDTQLAIIGDVTTNAREKSIVTLVDSTGLPTWSKSFQIENYPTWINNVIKSKSNDIVIQGGYRINQETIALYAAAIALDGTLKWTTDFNKSKLEHSSTSLNLAKEGMLISYNSKSKEGNDAIGLINVMDDGKTLCNNTISAQLTDVTIEVDTLIVTRTSGIIIGDTVSSEITEYDKINEPMLIVDPRAKAYCPNEPIMETIKATVSLVDISNVTYKWSTKETTDSIVVMKEGMYMVTATVSENTCYSLCDTVNLTRKMPPKLKIELNNSTFCEQGFSVLSGVVEGGSPSFSYQWSTGATTPTINVDKPGIYGLQVKDQCQDSSSILITYTLPVNQITSDPVIRTDNFCTSGIVTLIPNVSSTLGDPTKLSYSWSNGATTPTIDVSQEGSYSVEVTDNCGDKITVPFTVTLPVNQIISNPVIREDDFCTSGIVTLIPNVSSTLGDPTKLSYSWSNGATTSTIDVSQEGSYSVEVTDNCGDKITVPFTVTLPVKFDSKVVDSGVIVDCEKDPNFEYSVTLDGSAVSITWTDDNGSKNGTFSNKKSSFKSNSTSANYVIDLGCTKIRNTLKAACTCMEYAKVFFPQASVKDSTSLNYLDASFGGVFVCEGDVQDVITDYEFKIFNRWGQEVYSATDPTAKWNGKWNDNFVAPDVYVWYAKYKDNGNTYTKKGDVTVVY